MTSTATLRFTSSRATDNSVRIARVLAAGRVLADREAAQRRDARRHRVASAWVREIAALGAVEVGFKVCDDMGKHRFRVDVEHAADRLALMWGGDVEAWGVTEDGEYVQPVW